MLKRMPPHKRRRKSKARISVALTNQSRITVRDGKLTVTKANANGKSVIRDDATGFADASECLADSVVMLPLGKQTLSIRHSLKQCRALARLARKYGIRLLPIRGNATGIVTDVTGHTEDVIEFCNHVAGHSDLVGAEIVLAESAIESTGTDGHVRDAIQFGYTSPPKRIDYTAGRNQPKASYPIDNRYSDNDTDHVDTRNNGKVAGRRAPQIAHTEH